MAWIVLTPTNDNWPLYRIRVYVYSHVLLQPFGLTVWLLCWPLLVRRRPGPALKLPISHSSLGLISRWWRWRQKSRGGVRMGLEGRHRYGRKLIVHISVQLYEISHFYSWKDAPIYIFYWDHHPITFLWFRGNNNMWCIALPFFSFSDRDRFLPARATPIGQ